MKFKHRMSHVAVGDLVYTVTGPHTPAVVVKAEAMDSFEYQIPGTRVKGIAHNKVIVTIKRRSGNEQQLPIRYINDFEAYVTTERRRMANIEARLLTLKQVRQDLGL